MTSLELEAIYATRSNSAGLMHCRPSSDFEELALPLLGSVYNSAQFLTGNRSDAEDLVQDTYLKALRGFATFEPGSNFRAWIFRILKNTFLSSRTSAQYRGSSAQVSFHDLLTELPSRSTHPIETLIDQDRLQTIQIAVEQLPAGLREVLVLCDVQEASYRETADALSIPVGTVMSRLARARKVVRESIHDIRDSAMYANRQRPALS